MPWIWGVSRLSGKVSEVNQPRQRGRPDGAQVDATGDVSQRSDVQRGVHRQQPERGADHPSGDGRDVPAAGEPVAAAASAMRERLKINGTIGFRAQRSDSQERHPWCDDGIERDGHRGHRVDGIEHEHPDVQQCDGDRGGDDRGLRPLQSRRQPLQVQSAGVDTQHALAHSAEQRDHHDGQHVPGGGCGDEVVDVGVGRARECHGREGAEQAGQQHADEHADAVCGADLLVAEPN